MNENRNQNRNLILILGALVVVVVCCCLFVLAAGGLWFGLRTPVSSSSVPYPAVTVEVQVPPAATSESGLPTATPKASPGSGSGGSSLPEEAPDSASIRMTEQALADAVVPARDLRVLAERLRGTGPIPEVVDETPANFQVGDTQTFWVSNDDSQEHFQIDAELVYVNDVLYIWVEKGVPYNLNDIKASADRFANETYPTNRNFFGSEWSPGVDGDPRLHILHSEQLGDRIAGYFSGADEVSHLAQPFSNEREMFYINIGNTEPNSQFYNGVLSHEFQHMIHWYQDKNESTWVNEGMSELATELNGYSRGGADTWFSELPDTQLNAWDDAPDARTEHYGNAYLFMSYFLQRFGNEMTQAVVASDANGIDGFNDVLAAENTGLTFDDVFADWVIANYLDDPSLEDGRYGYQRDDLEPMALDASHRRYPIQREAEVHQYATDYVELNGSGDLQVDFHGATTTRLASNEPHSGQFSWWANRVDDSDARLTGTFDLSGVDTATLEFWTWYDIEDDWDYAYVMASSDGGQTWTPLKTEDATDTNPNGNSFGWALTGCSGDASSQAAGDACDARWIQQTADLTPYAGNDNVLVRFEYITDDAVNYPGFFVDDVSIPEIGFSDDAETDGGWTSEGWVRSDNLLRQSWLVQLIVLDDGRDPMVMRLPVDETGHGQWTIAGLNRSRDAILAISATTPHTTEVAPYEYSISETR